MKTKLILTVSISIILLFISACATPNTEKADPSDGTSVESVEEQETEDAENNSSAPEEVSPEFDANGNPTGEYAKYLWEQQQMEDAKNSMAEEAMREYYDEQYEEDPNGFPF